MCYLPPSRSVEQSGSINVILALVQTEWLSLSCLDFEHEHLIGSPPRKKAHEREIDIADGINEPAFAAWTDYRAEHDEPSRLRGFGRVMSGYSLRRLPQRRAGGPTPRQPVLLQEAAAEPHRRRHRGHRQHPRRPMGHAARQRLQQRMADNTETPTVPSLAEVRI